MVKESDYSSAEDSDHRSAIYVQQRVIEVLSGIISEKKRLSLILKISTKVETRARQACG
jgi:hypothetical protein